MKDKVTQEEIIAALIINALIFKVEFLLEVVKNDLGYTDEDIESYFIVHRDEIMNDVKNRIKKYKSKNGLVDSIKARMAKRKNDK